MYICSMPALTIIDLSPELEFKTSRSGGKGGQNVNKVETKVEARWQLNTTKLLTPEQVAIVTTKLASRINANGELVLTSSTHRTQLGNKLLVVRKLNAIVHKALTPVKKRVPTKVPNAVKTQRANNKKLQSQRKSNRSSKWNNEGA
jgi:ribosome-associated protein